MAVLKSTYLWQESCLGVAVNWDNLGDDGASQIGWRKRGSPFFITFVFNILMIYTTYLFLVSYLVSYVSHLGFFFFQLQHSLGRMYPKAPLIYNFGWNQDRIWLFPFYSWNLNIRNATLSIYVCGFTFGTKWSFQPGVICQVCFDFPVFLTMTASL